MRFEAWSMVLAALLSCTAVSMAQAEDKFGEKGQLAISSESALLIQHSETGDDDEGSTKFVIGPAVDFLVMDGLSLGAAVSLEYTAVGEADTTRLEVGPRVGYNLYLSDALSIWPKLGFSVAYTNSSVEVGPVENDTDSTSVAINLFAPLMLYPVEHVFIGFGPFLDADITGDVKTTTFGGQLILGGWLWVDET